MVKTGMTRRLDPLNQVRELGNASGPPQGRSPAEINDLWSAAPRALPGRLPLVFGVIRVIIADFIDPICGDDHPYITR
jgi:hypothetical protein